MVLQLSVADVMTQPVLSVTPETPLQQAVQLISDHHISGLPVVDEAGALIGELSEQDLMVRESGVDAGLIVEVAHGAHLEALEQLTGQPAA